MPSCGQEIAKKRAEGAVAAQRDHVHPPEVLDSGGVLGVRPAGARPGRLEQQGDQARELRRRAGGGVRLLDADVPGPGDGHARTGSPPGWRCGFPTSCSGLAGIGLLFWRHRHADAGVQITLPSAAADPRSWLRPSAAGRPTGDADATTAPRRRRARRRRRHGRGPATSAAPASSSACRTAWCPSFKLLDSLRRRAPTCGCWRWPSCGMLGIFYIASFIDWSDNLFKGQATGPAARAVHVVLDAAVHLLRAAAVGAGRDARHHRPADQIERADRHAGLRRQPLSHRAAARRLRAGLERRAVRARGDDARRRPTARPPSSSTSCAAARRAPSTC